MSEELKPCPFCGGDASLIVKTFFGFPEEDIYKVACNDCKSHYCYSDDCEETVKVWNHRPAEDANDKEIENLKAALKQIAEIANRRGRLTVATLQKDAWYELEKIAKEALFNAPDTGEMEKN